MVLPVNPGSGGGQRLSLLRNKMFMHRDGGNLGRRRGCERSQHRQSSVCHASCRVLRPTESCRGVFVKVPFAAAGFLFCAGSMLQVNVALYVVSVCLVSNVQLGP
jgi:hypothetical protein